MRPYPDTSYRFDFTERCYKRLTVEEAQAPGVRSHPDNPIKSNRDKPLDLEDKAVTKYIGHHTYPIPRQSARDENMRKQFIRELRSFILKREQTYLIDEDHDLAKVANYGDDPISTKGTSVPGRLTFTAGVFQCSGVLLAGEKWKNEQCLPGSKERVSHVLKFADDPSEFDAISEQVKKMRDEGFEVSVSIFGGKRGNEASSKDFERLRKLFSDLEVKIKSDETIDKRPPSGHLFGGAIDEIDHTVQRVKQVATYDLIESPDYPVSAEQG